MPELIEILNEEEASFARTLNRGEALFSRYATTAAEEKRTTLSGKDVWRLYDTYGFPVDLTQIMAEERGLTFDEADFEKARLESLEASKAGGKSAGAVGVKLDVHDLGALEANAAVPKTNDSFKYRQFLPLCMLRELTNRTRRCQGHYQEHLPLFQILRVYERGPRQLSVRYPPRQDKLLRRARRSGE